MAQAKARAAPAQAADSELAVDKEAAQRAFAVTIKEGRIASWRAIASADPLAPGEVLETRHPDSIKLDGDKLVEKIADDFAEEQLAEARRRKADEINTEAELAILSGFTSSALGAPHRYQGGRDDQLNLVGAVLAVTVNGGNMLFRCDDEAGARAFRLHSASELAQVLRDGAARKLAILQRAEELKAMIAAATLTELDVVQWVPP